MSPTAAPELSRNASVQARSVIRSDGRASRVLLTQPPHFRRGQDASPPVDRLLLDIDAAIRSGPERFASYRSTGKRAITTN